MTKFGTLADELESDFPAVDVTSVVFSRDFVGVGCCVIPQEKVLEIIAALRLASMPDREADAWEWRACIGGRWGAWLHLDQPIERFRERNRFNLDNGTYELRPLFALTRAQRTDDQTS